MTGAAVYTLSEAVTVDVPGAAAAVPRIAHCCVAQPCCQSGSHCLTVSQLSGLQHLVGHSAWPTHTHSRTRCGPPVMSPHPCQAGHLGRAQPTVCRQPWPLQPGRSRVHCGSCRHRFDMGADALPSNRPERLQPPTSLFSKTPAGPARPLTWLDLLGVRHTQLWRARPV